MTSPDKCSCGKEKFEGDYDKSQVILPNLCHGHSPDRPKAIQDLTEEELSKGLKPLVDRFKELASPDGWREKARETVARGWDRKTGAGTDTDKDLAVALTQNVVDEVAKSLRQAHEQGQQDGLRRALGAVEKLSIHMHCEEYCCKDVDVRTRIPERVISLEDATLAIKSLVEGK